MYNTDFLFFNKNRINTKRNEKIYNNLNLPIINNQNNDKLNNKKKIFLSNQKIKNENIRYNKNDMNGVNKFSSINIINDYSNEKGKRIRSNNHINFIKGVMPTTRKNINNYEYNYKKNKNFKYANSIYGNNKDDILSINSLSIQKLMLKGNSKLFFFKNNMIQDKKTIKNSKSIIYDEYKIKYKKNFDDKKIIKKDNENIEENNRKKYKLKINKKNNK